jgi:N-alpha-acetyltransferase 15/16, NatA auxiliary subunit
VLTLVEKYLLALRCLNAALAIDATNPVVHEQAVRFHREVISKLASLPAKVAEVIKSEFTALETSTDLKKHNAEFLEKHRHSAPHVVSAVKIQKLLGEDPKTCEKGLFSVLSLKSADWEPAAEALGLLLQWRSGEAETFKKAAQETWPEVTLFSPPPLPVAS